MKQITPKVTFSTLSEGGLDLSKVSNSYWKGLRMMRQGSMLSLPLVALEAGTAQKGEMIPTLTGRMAGLMAQPVMAGMISAVLASTLGFPPVAAAVVSGLLVGAVATTYEDKLIRTLTTLSKYGAESNHVRFGGSFQDSATAQARRQRALRDLAGASIPARRWLGQEALVLHR
jgi:hypothetical protein